MEAGLLMVIECRSTHLRLWLWRNWRRVSGALAALEALAGSEARYQGFKVDCQVFERDSRRMMMLEMESCMRLAAIGLP